MGLWHGIEPYYLLYGLYHGTLLVGHDLFTRWNKPRRVWGNGPLWRAAGTLVTFHLVCLGFLLFSGRIGPTWKPASSVPPATQGAAPALCGVLQTSIRSAGSRQVSERRDSNAVRCTAMECGRPILEGFFR